MPMRPTAFAKASAVAFGVTLSGAWMAAPGLGAAQSRDALSPYRPPSKDPRNIAGAYQRGDDGGDIFPVEGGLPPLTPAAKAIYDRRVEAEKTGAPQADVATSCLPQGTPRILLGSFPHFIYQVDKEHSASGVEEVIFMHELMHLVRHVYIGEAHPAELDPTFLGHQVGRWEGDTLVVDTVGLKDLTWVDDAGIPHSKDFHVVERWRKIKGGAQLEVLITLEDPAVFTRPWTTRRVFDWSPNIRETEYVCEENNRNSPDETGRTGVVLTGR